MDSSALLERYSFSFKGKRGEFVQPRGVSLRTIINEVRLCYQRNIQPDPLGVDGGGELIHPPTLRGIEGLDVVPDKDETHLFRIHDFKLRGRAWGLENESSEMKSMLDRACSLGVVITVLSLSRLASRAKVELQKEQGKTGEGKIPKALRDSLQVPMEGWVEEVEFGWRGLEKGRDVGHCWGRVFLHGEES